MATVLAFNEDLWQRGGSFLKVQVLRFYENNSEETSFKPWRAEENEYTVILRAALLYLGDIYYSSLGERSAGLTNTADEHAVIDVDAALKELLGHWRLRQDFITRR